MLQNRLFKRSLIEFEQSVNSADYITTVTNFKTLIMGMFEPRIETMNSELGILIIDKIT